MQINDLLRKDIMISELDTARKESRCSEMI